MRISISYIKMDEKTSEIKAVPKLFRPEIYKRLYCTNEYNRYTG